MDLLGLTCVNEKNDVIIEWHLLHYSVPMLNEDPKKFKLSEYSVKENFEKLIKVGQEYYPNVPVKVFLNRLMEYSRNEFETCYQVISQCKLTPSIKKELVNRMRKWIMKSDWEEVHNLCNWKLVLQSEKDDILLKQLVGALVKKIHNEYESIPVINLHFWMDILCEFLNTEQLERLILKVYKNYKFFNMQDKEKWRLNFITYLVCRYGYEGNVKRGLKLFKYLQGVLSFQEFETIIKNFGLLSLNPPLYGEILSELCLIRNESLRCKIMSVVGLFLSLGKLMPLGFFLEYDEGLYYRKRVVTIRI